MARDSNGRFLKGESGNPNGRPSMDLCQVRAALHESGEQVAKKVLEKALGGDMSACKLVLERICPALKPRSTEINLPEDAQSNPKDQAQKILAAAMQGVIAPDIAAQLVSSVGVLSRIIETDELRDRIESLERILGRKSNENKK